MSHQEYCVLATTITSDTAQLINLHRSSKSVAITAAAKVLLGSPTCLS